MQDLEIPHCFNDRAATHFTISAGFVPMKATYFDDALANADRALYLAKNRGRNTIPSYCDIEKWSRPTCRCRLNELKKERHFMVVTRTC
ncbi:diguanylate cyclase [Erwinia tracheiphila]|uniref:Diguanylate cyclase n=1 Tax=Erwinia tracheiphila TaxID=65700 RepID=A0A0M2K9H9_9GAMM|nr:hemin storage system protein T [Erwinia tracheiphila PSU-1]KKF36040.1 hypothetical protein SY86_12390 [Erwinia tracheiphila]